MRTETEPQADQTLRVREVEIARRYCAVSYRDEDGPGTRLFDAVVVTTIDGRQWVLPNGRREERPDDGCQVAVATYDADALMPEVQRRGVIRLDYWTEVVQESLEELLEAARIDELRDRAAWGG